MITPRTPDTTKLSGNTDAMGCKPSGIESIEKKTPDRKICGNVTKLPSNMIAC